MRTLSEREVRRIVGMARCGEYRYADIGEVFGITEQHVSKIAIAHGVQRNHKWTPEEEALLRENYWEHGATGLKKILPRHPSRQVIQKHAKLLGLKTRVGPYGKLRRVDGEDEAEGHRDAPGDEALQRDE